jgi:hypothetical protein
MVSIIIVLLLALEELDYKELVVIGIEMIYLHQK